MDASPERCTPQPLTRLPSNWRTWGTELMLRLAILSARGRPGAFVGALIALTAAAVLATAWGMQLESILRTHAPVERYAATAAVVTGHQQVGTDHDVYLHDRARVSTVLRNRLAAVPGAKAAIGDVSVPAQLGNRATIAHGRSEEHTSELQSHVNL